MASAGALPYLVPRLEAVRFQPWQIAGDTWTALPDVLSAWDPDTTFLVSQTVDVDLDLILVDTRLPPGTAFYVTATWTSSSSGMKMPIARVESSTSGPVVLQGHLEGRSIAGALDIETTLALARSSDSDQPGIVSNAGAVLARASTRLNLESASSMFPVAVVDFARTRMDVDASWRLETTTDLASSFVGEFRLLINSRDRDLVRAVQSQSPSTLDGILVAELEGEVSALLYELALMNRLSISEGSDWPDGSVGSLLSSLLDTATEFGIRGVRSDPIERAAFVARIGALVRSQGQGRQFA